MRSPIGAMLWENWRLTRVEAAGRLGVTLVVAAAAMTLFAPRESGPVVAADGAVHAFFVAAVIHASIWLSVVKLNGGRFLDGYHPGFPLHVLYTRPVSTAALVGVAMVYSAVAGSATYLVWALLMRALFDVPFPLLPVAAWMAVLQLVQAAAYWATRSKFVQWAGSFGAFGACIVLALRRVGSGEALSASVQPDQWPALFAYSFIDYAMMLAIALASYGVTVAGVARQRRGDARPPRPVVPPRPASSDWLAGLFRFPCPTTSPTRAQLWFDFKVSGLAVLGMGLFLAALIPLLFAVSGPIDVVRPYAIFAPVMAPLALMIVGGNAFGIRRRQGRTYASLFDSTQAYGTGSLAALKVLTRTACVVFALAVVAVSLWISLPLMATWPNAGNEAPLLQGAREAIADVLTTWSLQEIVALVIILFSGVAVMVAVRASLEALFARYRRRVITAVAFLLVYGLVVVLVTNIAGGRASDILLLNLMLGAVPVLVAAALTLGTLYLLWRTVAERILAPHQAAAAVLASAVVALACATLLGAMGAPISSIPPLGAVLALSPSLLTLTALVLAPWSLSRVRHL